MQDEIQLSVYFDELGDIVVGEFEASIVAVVGDVILAPGEQVIHADDLVPPRQKEIAQV